jgi:hypothetical protein
MQGVLFFTVCVALLMDSPPWWKDTVNREARRDDRRASLTAGRAHRGAIDGWEDTPEGDEAEGGIGVRSPWLPSPAGDVHGNERVGIKRRVIKRLA